MLLSILSNALKNRHTTTAALLYALAKWGCPVLAIWWPSHKTQIDSTANILEGAAVAYGFITAGDAGKSATKEDLQQVKQDADTVFLKKSDVKPTNPT